MREDLQHVLDHAGYGKRVIGLPFKPVLYTLVVLDKLHMSPIYPWVFETAAKDSYVDIDKAGELLGWQPRLSNKVALLQSYLSYVEERQSGITKFGTGHRTRWNQGILKFAKLFF